MRIKKHNLVLTVFLSLTVPVLPVDACSLASWDSATTGATTGKPDSGISRVAGQCALRVSGKGHVVDNSPLNETEFTGRFYFYPKMLNPGTYEIFAAQSDQTKIASRLFVISYDGSHIHLDASAAGGGQVNAVAKPNHWNLVEFTWRSGKQGRLWVNKDASSAPPNKTFPSGTGSVDQVRLGALDGVGTGKAFFDDYVSQRSSTVGPLQVGDGNSDGVVDSRDVDVVVNEYLFDVLGSGVVDCNLDGSVNSGDVNCVVAEF